MGSVLYPLLLSVWSKRPPDSRQDRRPVSLSVHTLSDLSVPDAEP